MELISKHSKREAEEAFTLFVFEQLDKIKQDKLSYAQLVDYVAHMAMSFILNMSKVSFSEEKDAQAKMIQELESAGSYFLTKKGLGLNLEDSPYVLSAELVVQFCTEEALHERAREEHKNSALIGMHSAERDKMI